MKLFTFIVFGVCAAAMYSDEFGNSLALEAIVSKRGRSMVVATMPIRWALCKLASVAIGPSKDELLKVLSLNQTEVSTTFGAVMEHLSTLSRTDLVLFNRMFFNYSREIDTRFFADSARVYGVGVESVGFNTPDAAARFINNKVATVTLRRITDLLRQDEIADDTKMMILTGLYLKPTWTPFSFDHTKTRTRKFYHMNGLMSDVPMMQMEGEFDVDDGSLGQVITISLQMATMTIIVPKTPRDLHRVLTELRRDPTAMKTSWMAAKSRLKTLMLPRFKIKSELDLTDIFKYSSLKDIFNSSFTGLNSILKEEYRKKSSMFVSKVKQKVFLEVDEFGMAPNFLPNQNGFNFLQSKQELVADRPFYFSIDLLEMLENKQNLKPVQKLVLLHGVYYGPGTE